jgi:hypothetical protein
LLVLFPIDIQQLRVGFVPFAAIWNGRWNGREAQTKNQAFAPGSSKIPRVWL